MDWHLFFFFWKKNFFEKLAKFLFSFFSYTAKVNTIKREKRNDRRKRRKKVFFKVFIVSELIFKN